MVQDYVFYKAANSRKNIHFSLVFLIGTLKGFAPFSVILLSKQYASGTLLLLVTILTQTLLTLVGRHLVTLMLLSVWHSCKY